jgi:hypothetical protein
MSKMSDLHIEQQEEEYHLALADAADASAATKGEQMTTFTIKNVKIAEFASEETLCFEGTLYVDGECYGHVSNTGQGGPNSYESLETERSLSEIVKAADIKVEAYDTVLTKDLDWIVSDLVNEYEMIKEARAWKRKVAKKNNYDLDSLRVFHIGDKYLIRGNDGKSDEESAAEIGEGARRIDNALPNITI